MNDLQVFNNSEFGNIRATEVNGEVMFVGKDVAEILGYSNPRKALSDHVDEEDKTNGVTIRDSIGREQNPIIINESGLYSLILLSKMPNAKKFKRWVTSEVLPSIRKHGAYMTPETIEAAILNPDTMIQLCNALKDEQNKNKALQEANSVLTVENAIAKPKAEYFDELVERNLLTNFRETAKQLGIPPKKFVEALINHKYIYRDKRGRLMPYSQHVDNGLFEIKESFNEKTAWSGTQTLITPKGRETFRLLYVGV